MHCSERDREASTRDEAFRAVSPLQIPESLRTVDIMQVFAQFAVVISIAYQASLVARAPHEALLLTDDERIRNAGVPLEAKWQLVDGMHRGVSAFQLSAEP